MKLTIISASESFERLVKSRSELTEKAYRADMEHYRAWTKEETVPHALYALLKLGQRGARLHAEKYAAWMTGRRSLARNTVLRRLSALKSFVAEAARDGLVDWKLGVVVTKRVSRDAKIGAAARDMSGPDREQFRKVMAQLDAHAVSADHNTRLTALRDRAIVALLHNPMLRRAELCALNCGDVSTTKGAPTVRVVGKGRAEPETLPLPPGGAVVIAAWLNVRRGSRAGPLFVRLRNDLGKRPLYVTEERLSHSAVYKITTTRGLSALGKKARRMNPHALRHSGATELANVCTEQRIPYTEGMKITRHKTLETFLKYVDRKGERSRELVEAIERRAK